VLAEDATVAARYAAGELQYHVQKITGAQLPVVTDNMPVDGPRILLGQSKATRAARVRRLFKPQEYVIQFLPDAVALVGRDAKGKFGGALVFNGKTTVVTAAECAFNDQVGSLEAWFFMPAEKPARHGTILRLDGDGPWTYHIIQRDANSDTISYTTYDGEKTHWVGKGGVTPGWHHVLGTYDAATGKQELFIDGICVGRVYQDDLQGRAPGDRWNRGRDLHRRQSLQRND